MAIFSSNTNIASLHHLFFFFFIIMTTIVIGGDSSSCINSIFSFGDETSDTGNYVIIYNDPNYQFSPDVRHLPFGITYFNKPSGRLSNGRLIIDFIADALGLPFLPPYLANLKPEEYRQGANFAVIGATALDPHNFQDPTNYNPSIPNTHLAAQYDWFKSLLPSLCSNQTDCEEYLKTSLMIVGGIGASDYDFTNNKNMTALRAMVPNVVEAIAVTVNDLITLGATEIVVPGLLPIGCMSTLGMEFSLIDHATNNTNVTMSSLLDPLNGCVKDYNDLAESHNTQLQVLLQILREHHPHANIVYADFYNNAIRFINSPKNYGFNEAVRTPCCSYKDGISNYDITQDTCSMDYVCDKPDTYVNWDLEDMSEAAYHLVASAFINGDYNLPAFNITSKKC